MFSGMAGRTPLKTWYKICKEGNIDQQAYVFQWLHCLSRPPLSRLHVLKSWMRLCVVQASILSAKSAPASEQHEAFSATLPSSCTHHDLIHFQRILSGLSVIPRALSRWPVSLMQPAGHEIPALLESNTGPSTDAATAQSAHTLKTLGMLPAESVAAHLRGGVAVKDCDPCEHLQHDHAKAVHVARAGHPSIMQHLHWLVRHRACTIHHHFTQSLLKSF